MLRTCVLFLAIVGSSGAAGRAAAQPKVVLHPPKHTRIDNLVPVPVRSARCAAISDVHGLIAFGHDHVNPEAQITLFQLDARGNASVYGTPMPSPFPKGLEKFPRYTLGLAFHPRLPLLYVWQDCAVPYSNPPPPAPPEIKDFDHLLIYNVAKSPPELVLSFCRGPEYIYGQQGGSIAIDPAGSYLYIPNMRQIANAGSLRQGRFPLDTDGLPSPTEPDAKEPMPAKLKRLTEGNRSKPPTPPQMTPIEYVYLFPLSTHGCGMSFQPLSKDVVITSGWSGLITWRPEDKNVAITALSLRHYGHTRIAVHPTLPLLFASVQHHLNLDSFFRVEHVEGYLTLLPRQYVIPESKLQGPPVIMSKRGQLVIGGEYRVYLVDLDAKGLPGGPVHQAEVLAPSVQGLAYSERFDRIYVGVEVSK